MLLSSDLAQRGFSTKKVSADDLRDYVRVIEICLKKYIDESHESFGEWNDENVEKEFFIKMERTLFEKLLLHGEIVGFFAYDVKEDKIDGISINLVDKARNNGIGSLYLTHIIGLSDEQNKPIFLTVMKTNPAVYLYARHGFKHHNDLPGLYQMVYHPKNS